MVDVGFQGVIVGIINVLYIYILYLFVYLASIWYAMWLGETKPTWCVTDKFIFFWDDTLIWIPSSLTSAVEVGTEMDPYADLCRTPTDIPAWVWCKQQTRKSFSRPLDKQQMAMNCSHLFACLEETFSSLGWTIFMIFMMFRLLSRHQPCWICRMWSCTSSMPCLVWRPSSNPRLGFVDSSIERTNMNEQTNINGLFRRPEARGSLLQPDGQVVALREARVTYIEGRPFHAYWRIRLG